MAHDVFISHSSRDKPVADAVCAALENAGVRCWIAPRDVQPGRPFAGEITRAIQQSKAMVLIFSANSNNSSQILREVQLAVEAQLHILQFRIEEVLLNDDLKYYLSTPHWLDAMTPPLENHLSRLAASLKLLLGSEPAIRKLTSSPVDLKAAPPVAAAAPMASGRNWRLPVFFAILLLGAVIAAVILSWRGQSAPKTDSPVIAKWQPLFVDKFDSATESMTPLFGPKVMSARNTNGEAEVTGRAPGILAAMFDKFVVADFLLECEVRAPAVPSGAAYGFIFRAADVANGGIAKYYVLLLDPNEKTVMLNLWKETQWITGPARSLPQELVTVGRKSHITLEARGNRFRVFIDAQLVLEPSFTEPFALKEGRVGFCLSGVDARPWTVYFDNLKVSVPAAATP
jgi:TIR domain